MKLKEYTEKLSQIADKKAEEIKSNEAMLRGIFDLSSPYAIAFIDPAGIIVECNQATLSMFECATKFEIIGKNVYEFVRIDSNKAAKIFEAAFKESIAKNVEYVFTLESGRKVTAEFSASIIKDSGKNHRFCSSN